MGNVSQGIVHATSIADFKGWPDKEGSVKFGDNKINSLVQHFTSVLHESGADVSKIPDEWTALKAGVYSEPSWSNYIKSVTWSQLNRKYGKELPNVLMLVDLILSLPASTAECERGFNVMKQIKSDWRSTLSTEAINDLMIVLLLSPDIKDFDPQKAIDLWATSGFRQRRPNFMDSYDEEALLLQDEEMVCVALANVQEENETQIDAIDIFGDED